MKKLLIILAILLSGCSSSDDDCAFERAEITEQYIDWIDQARESNDNEQVRLLIDERNKRLSKLGC